MRHVKVLGISIIALLAIGATAAGGASASVLVLKSGGVEAKKGTPAIEAHLTFVGECVEEAEGKVTVNAKATDTLAFKPAVEAFCEETGFAVTGGVKTVTLNNKGKAIFKASPKVAVSEPGPCVYEYAKFEGLFGIPGDTFVAGEAIGKVNRKVSNPLCSGLQATEFEAEVVNFEGSLFETELRA